MPTNYVLIDLENVQPKNLNILLEHPFKIYVFVGENQKQIPFDLAETMQSFGENGTYIKISKQKGNYSAMSFRGVFCREIPETALCKQRLGWISRSFVARNDMRGE